MWKEVLVSLIVPDFFHRVSYKVFVLKDRLIISKNKIIEMGVASKK